ncbi:putative ribonuclease H-like domain-containing protein [Tanacetum coccineum]
MDVKSAFLYAKIDEEAYVSQLPGFLDPKYPQKVYKVVKALYGLHQAPRAWYATLSTFLLKNGYRRGTIEKTLFLKKDKHDIILVQVYVDDIIFGSTKKSLCDEFEALMKSRFQMKILKKFDFVNVKTASTPIETQKPLVKDEEASDVDVHLYRSMIGSLMYLTASRPDIMFAVCACSRFQVTPKTSYVSDVKRIFRYLKGKPKLGLWYPKVSSIDLEAYSDSDYARVNLDRKSTTGGCQFLGRRLISWQCKKQTIVATSTIEEEYVAAASCCGQVLWIQNQMLEYGFNFMNTKIYIDNEITICIVKNPVYHSKTKHIDIRYHFIRDAYEKKLIQVLKIHTDDNVADLLTKAFDVSSLYEVFRKVTPLFASMLVQPTEDEGAPSERTSEAQPTPSSPHPSEATLDPQSDPSPRPLLSTTILDSIPESSSGNHGGFRLNQGNSILEGTDQEAQEASQTCYHTPQSMDEECLIKAKIGRKEILKEKLNAKGILEDTLDYMETEDAQDLGRTRDVVDEEKENAKDVLSTAQQKVSTDKEKVGTDRPIVSIDGSKVSTDKEKDSTDRIDEGTDDQIEGGRATQTPTSTIFGDDETIAQVLLNMSQAKAVSREKEKGVEFKDIEETEDAQDVGRTRDVVVEEKENAEDVLSTEDALSTAQQKVSTDKEKVSTDRPIVTPPKMDRSGMCFRERYFIIPLHKS